MKPFSETIDSLNMKLLTHSSEPVGHLYPGKGQTTPALTAKFLDIANPLKVICAHLGGGLPFYAHMPEIRTLITNAMFDTAAAPFLYEPSVIKTICEILSPRHVLFGSDYPLISQSRALQYVKNSGLDEEMESMVLGANAMSIYNL